VAHSDVRAMRTLATPRRDGRAPRLEVTVTCAPSLFTRAAVRHASRSLAAAIVLAALPHTPAGAQQPTPPPVMPYRPPAIALVQPVLPPAGTGSVPLDRPAVVFRFAVGEADDPLDVRSLVVAVDGADRTTLFQATPDQAWGRLASDEQLRRGELTTGTHRVVARICSTRGVCATAEAQVLVVPGVTSADAAGRHAGESSGTRRVLGAVLSATRKLLLP
jgi:hypothetical protein